jgi:hypothetical protein
LVLFDDKPIRIPAQGKALGTGFSSFQPSEGTAAFSGKMPPLLGLTECRK